MITRGSFQLSSKKSNFTQDTGSNFKINLGYTVPASSIIIDSITIPHYYTNINSWNNAYSYTLNSNPSVPLLLPPNQYTALTLAEEMSAQISTSSGIVVGIAPNADNYLLINVQASNTIAITVNQDLAQMLGINSSTALTSSFPQKLFTITILYTTGFLSPFLVSDDWQNIISVSISGLEQSQTYQGANLVSGNQYNFLATIPNSSPYGTISTYREQWGKIFKSEASISSIYITLLDDHNRVLNLNGKDTTLSVAYY
jgi:hypothetical protein